MHVVQALPLIVDGDVKKHVVGDFDQLQVGVVLDIAQVRAQGVDANVDLAGLQGDQPGGFLLDQPEHDPPGGGGLPIEAVVAHKGDLVAGDPIFHHVAAGADLIAKLVLVYQLFR